MIVFWRRTFLIATFITAALSAQGAQRSDAAKVAWPKEATLQNSSLFMQFRADKQGLRLTSLGNVITRKNYLRPTFSPADAEGLPPPALWEGRAPGVTPPAERLPEEAGKTDASLIGNPFYIVRMGPDNKPQVFHAATDFDVLSWRATQGLLQARLRGRGIFVEAEIKVSLAPDRSFWTLSLHNLSSEPLFATVGFPAFARLVVDGSRRDRVTVPWGSGATFNDPASLRWRGDYGAALSAPMALWHGDGEGLYLVDNGRSDTIPVPHETTQRALVLGSTEALGKEYSPSLALEHTVRLDKGGYMNLGPVVVGAYQGSAGLGAAQLSQLRGHMVRMPRPVSWLSGEPMIARHEGPLAAFTDGPLKRGWRVVLLSGFSDPLLGNYATIPEAMGGEIALKRSIAALHEAGGRALFVLDGSRIAKDSVIGKADGENWAVRGFDGKAVEEGDNWVICPANPGWRTWMGNVAVRLLRTYGADGIAVTGLAGSPAYTCINRQHGHTSPHAWVWGTRQVFSHLRDRLNSDAPNSALVSIGALDLVREFADAMVADTHSTTGYRMELPLLRAVYPSIRTYESATAATDLLSDRLRVWNIAHGLPFYAPSEAAAVKGPTAPRRLYEAYPEVLDARYYGVPVLTPSREIVASAATGTDHVLMAGNLGEENMTGSLRLPFQAAALEDKLTGRRVLPNASGAFPVSLLAQQAAFWRILPAP